MPSTKSALVMMSICVLYNIQQSLVPEQGGALAVASGVRRTRHAQLKVVLPSCRIGRGGIIHSQGVPHDV